MKTMWITALMIVTFSGVLAMNSVVSAGEMGSSGTTGQLAGFKDLDQNGDGRVSQQEANAQPMLAERFKRLDNNSDGYLDHGEFSRFETMERGKHRDEGRVWGPNLHEGEHW